MSNDRLKSPLNELQLSEETTSKNRDHALRLADEWQLAEDTFNNESVQNTISIFGSARIPAPEDQGATECLNMSNYYRDAQELAFQLGQYIEANGLSGTRLITGGGPGIMEAASRGAFDAGHHSIGLNISIPREQRLNPFIAAKHSIDFQYFALRKMHFLKRACALVVFPGGFGTLDELFETLTLIQTGKMPRIPVFLYGRDFWTRFMNVGVLAECGLIDTADVTLYHVVDTVQETFEQMQKVLEALENNTNLS